MGMYGITNNILILEKKTKILGKIWILVGFLNLLFNIIAVPFIGIIGAAIVTLLCYLIALLITIFYSRKYLELPYDYTSMIKIAISSIIMGIVVAIINPNGIWNVLITIIIGILVYFLVLFLIKGINKEELNFFKTMINES